MDPSTFDCLEPRAGKNFGCGAAQGIRLKKSEVLPFSVSASSLRQRRKSQLHSAQDVLIVRARLPLFRLFQ